MARHPSWQWLALQGGYGQLLENLTYQRGVYGKVHGARSDFRWIAESDGFYRGDGVTFYLGNEESPAALSLWRHLPRGDGAGHHFAGFAYPSRTQDAAGRSGFLEKQFADFSNLGMPAALAALLMLPQMRQWSDRIWWDRRDEQNWVQAGSVLTVLVADCASSLPPDLDTHLTAAIIKGGGGIKGLGHR